MFTAPTIDWGALSPVIIVLGAAIIGVLVEAFAPAKGRRTVQLAPGGMLVFPAAGDLLTLFVALEVLSLPLYLLTGMARRRRLLSQEASMKYFLLGAFASAMFVFGIALIYGYSGSLRYSDIA